MLDTARVESRCGALGAGRVLGDVRNAARAGVHAGFHAYAHADVPGAARGAVPACDRAFDYCDLALFFLAFLTLD